MKKFRSKVFRWAHEVRKETGKEFPVCLALAWRAYRLYKGMRSGIVYFTFEKKDGSLRKATGTLCNIPQDCVKGVENRERAWSEHFKAVPYYDLKTKGFCSFKITNLIEINYGKQVS